MKVTTVTPKAPFDSGAMLVALCIWREAQNQSRIAQLGVLWVMKNRCAMAPAQGFKHTINEEILRPFQFSSFNSNDVNSTKYPRAGDPVWPQCLNLANCDDPDPTDGAVFYFSKPLTEPPAKQWGPVKISAVIDGLTFCVIDDNPKIVT